jgi:hypothetical protein
MEELLIRPKTARPTTERQATTPRSVSSKSQSLCGVRVQEAPYCRNCSDNAGHWPDPAPTSQSLKPS